MHIFFFLVYTNIFLLKKIECIDFHSHIKVAFSGASVTRQKISYVTELQKIYPNWDVRVHSYPESRMSRCMAKKVLDEKPDIIFYEWSLHDGSTYNEIREIIYSTIKINAIPVFLHMPRTDGKNLRVLNFINQLSNEIGFSVIDLRNEFSQKQLREEYLRDHCHPNSIGAKAYAEYIERQIELNPVLKPKYFELGYNLLELNYDEINYTAYKNMSFYFTGKIRDMLIVKGPSSNYINIFEGQRLEKKILLWDSYCHYEREVKMIFDMNGLNETLTIQVLNEAVDRSSCRRDLVSWPNSNPFFKVLDICYEGELFSITVDGINHSHKSKNISIIKA